MIYMKRLRMNKGITMKKLGELVGVSESAISQYENLKRRPEYETLLRLCEELGCSAPDLFRDESEIVKRDDEYNLLAFFKRDMAFNHAPIFIFLQQ